MPQFSILVSELTPALLAKAEYWKIVGVSDLGGKWADTRPPYALIATGEPDYPLYLSEGSRHYHKNLRCFPVTLSPDGTEARLEMPQMPDEVEIEGIPPEWAIDEPDPDLPNRVYWVLDSAVRWRIAPTPEHYPRRTCDGVWVWSTRR